MAITITRSESRAVLYGASFATHTFNVDIGDIVINDADDNKISDYAPTPSYGLVKYNTSANGRTWLIDGFDIKFYMLGTMIRRTDYTRGSWQIYTPANVEAQLPVSQGSTYWTYANRKPSYYFNSTTKTTLSIPITYRLAYWAVQTGSDATGTIAQGGDSSESGDLGTFYLRLNVPPTFDTTPLSIDTSSAYTNVTTASVTVSNSTAYYGGDVTSVTLTIGQQSASISGDGTISILLDTAGTFTPVVTVTDSRGQVGTQTLDPLVVNAYSSPTVNFTADRTTSTGTPDDEGTYATLDATFVFSDVIASLIAPSVVLTDENGTQTTPTVTWYSSRAADGTLSGSVTWANLSTGDTVYGLVPGLNTNYSYQVSVRPRDNRTTGTAISQTVSSAFYTVDFLAGGHGIAFGKPASNVGFECAMDATFEADCVAQDMSAQEVTDFVNNLTVGGGGTAVDLVIEQGTDTATYSGATFIWTYRKWSSGFAEAWTYKEGTTNSGGDWQTSAYCPKLFEYTSQISVQATGWASGNANGGVRHAHPMQNSGYGGWLIDTWLRNGNANTSCGISWYITGRWE